MAHLRDSRADALPTGCVDGSRIPDGDRILEHRYRHPLRNFLRRQCLCGLDLCAAAAEAELLRWPNRIDSW